MMYRARIENSSRELTIEHDETAGFYLIIRELGSSISLSDHLCDTLEEAFLEAEELYGVEKSVFKPV